MFLLCWLSVCVLLVCICYLVIIFLTFLPKISAVQSMKITYIRCFGPKKYRNQKSIMAQRKRGERRIIFVGFNSLVDIEGLWDEADCWDLGELILKEFQIL